MSFKTYAFSRKLNNTSISIFSIFLFPCFFNNKCEKYNSKFLEYYIYERKSERDNYFEALCI